MRACVEALEILGIYCQTGIGAIDSQLPFFAVQADGCQQAEVFGLVRFNSDSVAYELFGIFCFILAQVEQRLEI